MKNLNFKFLYEQLQNNSIGYSRIFSEYYEGTIIILNLEKKHGYIWDEKTKLYKIISITYMYDIISELLMTIMAMMITSIKENDVIDDETKLKKVKELTATKNNFGKNEVLKNIYECFLKHYLDESMILKFDAEDNSIPLVGGKIINLHTGKIVDRTQKNYFTYEVDNKYLGYGDKYSPKTKQFFNQLTCNNEIKYNFLRLIFGSSITTDIKMKCFFILYGKSGDNGKSTLLSIMEKIFKDKYVALDEDLLFAEKKQNVTPSQFGNLIGKTIASAIEPSNKYIHGEIIKTLTGGDNVQGKKVYCNPVTFCPKIKIMIALNNIIRIQNDPIMIKRTRIINFDAKYCANPNPLNPNEYKGDADIESKFLNEWKADFFTFIINASIDYLKMEDRNLNQPKELEFERENYFNKMDNVNKFMTEFYNVSNNVKDRVVRSRIADKYSNYCNGHTTKFNKQSLFNYLNLKFGEARKDTDGIYCYWGLKIKSEYNELEDDLIDNENSNINIEINNNTINENIDILKLNDELIIKNENLTKENKQLLDNELIYINKIKEMEMMINELKKQVVPVWSVPEIDEIINQLIF